MAHRSPFSTPDLDLAGLGRRQPGAVEDWFRAFADPLYTFVYHRVGRNEELAADVAQETFATALAKIDSFDPNRGEMLPWLTFIARNCIRKALRDRRRYSAVNDLWEKVDLRLFEAFSALADEPLPDEVLERQETVELVHMALSNLPLRYQRALGAHYFEHRSLKQIAAEENVSEGAVKSLLHRARSAFQAAFEAITQGLAEAGAAERRSP